MWWLLWCNFLIVTASKAGSSSQIPLNGALGRPTSAVSNKQCCPASLAVDNIKPMTDLGMCYQSLPSDNTWWEVQLTANLSVVAVRIHVLNLYSVADDLIIKQRGLFVALSNSSILLRNHTDVVKCGNRTRELGNGETAEFRCSAATTAKYVTVSKNESYIPWQVLILCEVEVYVLKEHKKCPRGLTGVNCDTPCLQGLFGADCQDKCGMCVNGTCDRVTGDCQCKQYFEGDQCMIREPIKLSMISVSDYGPMLVLVMAIPAIAIVMVGAYFCLNEKLRRLQYDADQVIMEYSYLRKDIYEAIESETAVSFNYSVLDTEKSSAISK